MTRAVVVEVVGDTSNLESSLKRARAAKLRRSRIRAFFARCAQRLYSALVVLAALAAAVFAAGFWDGPH